MNKVQMCTAVAERSCVLVNAMYMKLIRNEINIVIYKALCFDVAQGRMNGGPNETRTHSCRFASLVC